VLTLWPAAPRQATDTFVITGDIEAMWLRDSTNQLLPYVPLAHKDPGLKAMLCGAIRRQARQVRTNRYANAFNLGEEAAGHKADAVVTKPPLTWRQEGEVYESKYELNSLANVLKLSTLYHTATGDLDCFRRSDDWLASAAAIVDTIAVQQAGTHEDFADPAYAFNRETTVARPTR
jgi:meiotically up-regulated gene 157 (Mug157) protein